jgi:hypothetical protein
VVRNNGRKTFAQKWGVPSSFFYKEVLQMGKKYDKNVVLKFPSLPMLALAKLKAFIISIR